MTWKETRTTYRWSRRSIAFYLLVLVAALALNSTFAQSGWDPIVQDACGGNADCVNRITWLIQCESGGNEYAVSAAINPGTGMHDYGLLQISPIWGDIAYADGASQISWAAQHLGSVWWAC